MGVVDRMTRCRGGTSTTVGVFLVLASLLAAAPIHAAGPDEAPAQTAEAANALGNTRSGTSAPDADPGAGPRGAEPAPTEAPTPAAPAATPPEPEAPSSAPARVAPTQLFARSGSWLLSADDALPLFSVGASNLLSEDNAVRYGHAGGFAAPAAPSALTLDYVLGARFTIGASPIVESTIGSDARGAIHFVGGALRVGHVFPLGEHLALWPHVGVAYVTSRPPDAYVDERHRADLVADLRLAWTPNGRWALTVGPSLSAPIAVDQTVATERIQRDCELSGGIDCGILAIGEPNPNVRIAVSAGLTVRLDEEPGQGARSEHDRKPVRFLVGAERIVSLARYRVEKGGEERDDDQLDLGVADTTSRFPSMPRVAFDVVLQERLTLGAAANVGFVRTGWVQRSLYPDFGTGSLVVGLAPRVGGLLPATDWLAFWPRVGMTWVYSTGRESAYHLGADVDGFLVLRPVEEVGLVVGPSLSLPLISGSEEVWHDTAKVLSVGVSGGLLLLL
ncbi:MAG: hypothetical protein BGO98_44990 [Myxococcales bacterium 68-20]|nr:MAG: hypothetical protein BGO98_44990 [Myxococcales bacterium 68-20]